MMFPQPSSCCSLTNLAFGEVPEVVIGDDDFLDEAKRAFAVGWRGVALKVSQESTCQSAPNQRNPKTKI